MIQIKGDILPDETVPQLVRRIKNLTGGTTYLPRFGEQVTSVKIQSESITIALDKISARDLPQGGWEVVAHGKKLVSLVKTEQSSWKLDSLVLWDENFTPYELDTPVNRKRLASEYQAQKDWEDDAYRWGNGSRFGQRDSADRQMQGYNYHNPVFYQTTTPKD